MRARRLSMIFSGRSRLSRVSWNFSDWSRNAAAKWDSTWRVQAGRGMSACPAYPTLPALHILPCLMWRKPKTICRIADVGKNCPFPALFLMPDTKNQKLISDFWYFKCIKSHIHEEFYQITIGEFWFLVIAILEGHDLSGILLKKTAGRCEFGNRGSICCIVYESDASGDLQNFT